MRRTIVLTDSYGKALDTEGLRPIAQPEIGEIETIVPGQEFEYEAEVQVRPEMTLSSIEGLSVEIPSGEATEADIDAQIDEFRDRFATTRAGHRSSGGRERLRAASPSSASSTVRSTRATRSTSTSTRWARASCPRSSRTRSSAVSQAQSVEAEFVIPETLGQRRVRRQDRQLRHRGPRDPRQGASRGGRGIRHERRLREPSRRCARPSAKRLDQAQGLCPCSRSRGWRSPRARRASRRRGPGSDGREYGS